jgi:tetratricopeptide (TPR) repeat protein
MTYNSMGIAYKNKGEYDKALEYYAKDLAITLATLGDQKFHTRFREISQNLAGCILDDGSNRNRKR